MTIGLSLFDKSVMLKMRRMFKPRVPECAKQCPSCPFGKKNNKAWAAVMRKLAKHFCDVRTVPPEESRRRVRLEVSLNPNFMCHHTVYDVADGMKRKPESDYRQCPGATKFYKENLP